MRPMNKIVLRDLMVCFVSVLLTSFLVYPAGARSLWDDDASDNYSDKIAVKEGDILMIEVSESAQGQTTNDKEREKEITVGGQSGQNESGSTFINDLAAAIPIFGATFEGISEFESEREVDAFGSLDTRMSVQVERVRENGILELKGKRKVKIDDEIQNLRFEGLARKEDVGPNNVIPSDRIANAQIFYEGELGLRNGQPRTIIGKTWKFFKNVIFY